VYTCTPKYGNYRSSRENPNTRTAILYTNYVAEFGLFIELHSEEGK
jgi:hypothetical protein